MVKDQQWDDPQTETSSAHTEGKGLERHGTTTFFVHPMGDTLVSVLGEVPLATAQQVARSVARRP